MKKTEKKPKYTLIYVSICDCGNDFHAYHFTTLKSARKALQECWKDAKREYKTGTFDYQKNDNEFAIWDKYDQGNQMTAQIKEYNNDSEDC